MKPPMQLSYFAKSSPLLIFICHLLKELRFIGGNHQNLSNEERNEEISVGVNSYRDAVRMC